jgi:hypothetical protein
VDCSFRRYTPNPRIASRSCQRREMNLREKRCHCCNNRRKRLRVIAVDHNLRLFCRRCDFKLRKERMAAGLDLITGTQPATAPVVNGSTFRQPSLPLR